ncbi:hypothetical protein [Streptomyces sp. NPDC020742]|uniref:hypothetical protein n=1 Tax=unclassified Streptomyces TaxID=2593676 RepID=UPI0033C42837
MARVDMVIAGACGLLLAVGGASPAQADDGPFGSDGGVFNSDTWADFNAMFHCKRRAKICINGPVNSGNVRNAQNVYVSGNVTNSGSPTTSTSSSTGTSS